MYVHIIMWSNFVVGDDSEFKISNKWNELRYVLTLFQQYPLPMDPAEFSIL